MNNLTREYLEGAQWRIKPIDALPSDKFKVKMQLIDIGIFPDGGHYARGKIYEDGRGIFLDGEIVRTWVIKDIYEGDGEVFIETRNTVYQITGDYNDEI